MSFSTKVTSRDKKLLIFLAVFLLVAGIGWFVLKPAIDDITALDQQIAEAELLQKQNQYSISRIEESKQAWDTAAKKLTDKSAEIYPMMEMQEIDRLFTMEALRFGFEKSDLRELSIAAPEDCLILLPYLEPEDKTLTNNKTEKPKGYLPGLYAAEVSFTLRGERSLLEGFCDELVNGYPAIRVSEFYWQTDKTDEALFHLTIHCQIYMSDVQSVAAAVPETEQMP